MQKLITQVGRKRKWQEVSLRNVPSVEEDLPSRYCISFKDTRVTIKIPRILVL